jgi:hypothetical protein
VIVGGVAAGIHGATRVTEDLDICPEWSEQNLGRLAAALTELQGQLSVGPNESVAVPHIDGVLISRMEIGTWATTAGRFDVLRYISTNAQAAGYEHLRPTALRAAIGGHEVIVAGLDAIIAAKRAANRPKDLEALPELEQIAAHRPASRAAESQTTLSSKRPPQPPAPPSSGAPSRSR